MLKLYNKEHEAIGALTNLKDYKIEYILSGEDSLEFSLSIYDENIDLVKEEGYIRTKFNEYVIKAIDPSQGFKRFSCVVNIESLKGKSILNIDFINSTLTNIIRTVISGTGWTLADNSINKRRTIRLKNTNALEVLREIRKVFRVDFRYDSINKIIYVYEQFGEDRGVYFSDELNLKSFSIPSDTYDYVTRLYPKGKDGLTIASINNGKEYIENFQYSNKVLELIWEDNRYTDVNSLKEDAKVKLDELSKPKRTYQASILDMAKQSKEYKFLDFFLGDTITLLSKQEKFRDKQRIVKYTEYPNDSSKNTCELGNTLLSFEELQQENEYKNQVVDNITSDNNTVDGSKVDEIKSNQISDLKVEVAKIVNLDVINANINNLTVQNVTITGELNVVKANIGTLNANIATIDELVVNNTAVINKLKVNKADVTDLNATNAIIDVLEVKVGKVETLVNGNLSSENIQAGGITGDRLNMKTIFVEDANIVSINANKINVGELNTNKVKIKSENGGIEIVGATQQFKDKNNRVRIQMGQDTQGNFNFIIKGEDGTTTLIDHNGIKEKAIADDLIKGNMMASDSVGEKQIDYNSFATGFNKDTNTTTLKATKIKLDNQNQTLEVAFNELKSTADNNTSILSTHTTQLNVQQGNINTIIQDTTIVKDGQTLKLKDEYNKTAQTVNTIQSTIGSHTTKIDEVTGKVTSVETSVNVVKRELDSITQRLASTETDISSIEDSVNNNKTEISTTKNKVSTIESSLSYITNRVSSVENITSNINGSVNSLQTRMTAAESKITDSAIVQTVSSQFYKKGETDTKYAAKSQITQLDSKINLKVDKNGIVSAINLSSESAKIKAAKIQLEGTVTVGEGGRHIKIENQDLSSYSSFSEGLADLKLQLGFRRNEYNTSTYIPKLAFGTNGMQDGATTNIGSYVLMCHYPGTYNPDKVPHDIFSITHRNKNTGNWNGYRTWGNGRVSLISTDDVVIINGKNGVTINQLNIDNLSPRTIGYGVSSILMHCGLEGNGKNLGWSGSRFNQVSAKAVWADTGNISDISKKENIRYLDSVEIRGIKVNPPILKPNTNTESDFVDITKEDLYNFIKNELKLCEFNYIESESTQTNFDHKIGFIANDVEGTKVGNKFVHKHEGILGYNLNTLVFILAGALQEEIKHREKLEYKLKKVIGEDYTE